MMHTKQQTDEAFGVQRYYILLSSLSFLGWAFETVFVFLAMGRWQNQGFMKLPFCPIYGSSLMATYWLAGTPDCPRGLLKNVEKRGLRYVLYAVIAFIVPTVAEFFVGLFFDKGFGIWLWSYAGQPLNLMGYIALPVSLAWMGLIFAFMKWLFMPIKKSIGKIPTTVAWGIAVSLFAVMSVDFVYQFMRIGR